MLINLDLLKSKKFRLLKINIDKSRDRQAQIIIAKAIKSINDAKLELTRKLNTNCKLSSGLCVIKKDDIIVTGRNYKKLLAMNAEGEIEYAIPITEPNLAFDVTSLDEHKVAVTTGYIIDNPGISIVDLIERKVTKFIELAPYPYGITCDGHSLICCVGYKDLHVISYTDYVAVVYSITTIPNTVLSDFMYVSEHDGKIFFTNPNESKVTCC